jgi:hypothetical protein
MARRVRFDGFTRADTVAVVTVLVLVGVSGYLIIAPALRCVRITDARCGCATNLLSIGRAMLVYAADHHDLLPVAGGRDTRQATGLKDWSAPGRHEAFGLDPNGTGGEATISSSLYLLIRSTYADVTPRTFLCKEDKGIREFSPATCGLRGKELTALWDFGPDPARHCSYSYHMPYGPYRLTTWDEPGTPVATDRNPWISSPHWKARNFSDFLWNGSTKQQRAGNAMPHSRDGQNVLFLDSHVEFAKRAFCGLDEDNIYTISGDQTGGDPLGVPPKLGSQPANPRDSLLVNDPPATPARRSD